MWPGVLHAGYIYGVRVCVHCPRTLDSLGLELQMLWAVTGCLGSNSGLLGEQLVLFTVDPSLVFWDRGFHWDLGLTNPVRLASKPWDLPFSGSPADEKHLCIPMDGSREHSGALCIWGPSRGRERWPWGDYLVEISGLRQGRRECLLEPGLMLENALSGNRKLKQC